MLIIPLLVFSIPIAFAEQSNVGTMYWKQEIISSNSFVDIYVHDNDMNKKEYPNFADTFTISVWSDSSPEGLEIPVVETGVYSGIFKGRVFIADSGDTVKNRLVSSPGDTVYAKYVDFTMPDDSTSEIFSAAIVKISGQKMEPLLEKIDPKFRMSTSVEKVPSWIKNNAGWWSNGDIDDDSFIQGIQFLIKEKILEIIESPSSEKSDEIPPWVKNNAGWWAEGQITESDFLSGISYLVQTGVMSVSDNSVEPVSDTNPVLSECQSITSNYKRLDCEKPIKQEILVHTYKTGAELFQVGPINYYWFGVNSEGNTFEISPTGQPILSIRMLADNTSSNIVGLNCTSPAICNYDVWDGSKSFKYSGMDFTSGQINLNPGTAKEFNILFGPNIGYGGTEFEYDSSKSYTFRINEPFGSLDVHLDLE